MPRTNPPLKWPLPAVVNPPDRICYKVEVPNDRAHIGAFLGAMFLLTKPYAWGDDSAHTALEVAAVWRDVFDSLIKNSCDVPDIPFAGTDGDDLLIRQNPDNPCILESSLDGITWCQWADLSLCIPAGNQPGSGTPQPEPGTCQTYHGQLLASGIFNVPTIVNTGDTLELTSISGATNDPTHDASIWRCPTGEQFFAGACVGFGVLDAGDPIPTINHMRTIYRIGSNYYDAMAGVFTVPGSVVNAQVDILINDDVRAGDNGTLTFDVKVCNNQTVETAWCRFLDFTFSNYAFSGQSPCTVPAGVWIAGSGWSTEDVLRDVTYSREICIAADLASPVRVTDLDMLLDFTAGTVPSGNTAYELILNSTVVASEVYPTEPTGTGVHLTWHGDMSAINQITIVVVCSEDPTPVYSGAALVRSLTINGLDTAATIGVVC